MSKKITTALAATAITLSLGALTAPTASASTVEATPVVGSVAICLGVPLGSVSLNFCI